MSAVKPEPSHLTEHLSLVQSPSSLVDNGGHAKSNSTASTPAAFTPQVENARVGYATQRVDLEPMIEQFNTLLTKENWIKYAQVISLFVLGKLSRKELCNELDQLFTSPRLTGSNPLISKKIYKTLIRLHNQLLLGIFSNSLRDFPMSSDGDGSWGFGNGNSQINRSRRSNKHSSQIETYKKIVMSLPLLDRQRLKAITKESGKRGFVLCSVLQARLNMIPKIPIVSNQDTSKHIRENNLKTPIEWTQDVVSGFTAPLSTDNYALPDTDSLYLRMTGISREHGLVGSVDTNTVEILSIALDQYLKSIVESAIDTIRYRRKKFSDFYDIGENGMYQPMITNDAFGEQSNDDTTNPIKSLTNEDLYETFTIFPSLLQNQYTKLSLSSVGLVNDDDYVKMESGIDDLPDFLEEQPNFTPVDDKNIGSREELNWLIKGILTEK